MTEPIEPVDPAEQGDPAEQAEAPWAPSQDEWQQIAGAVQYLAELEQQRASVYQQPQTNGGGPTINPWDDNFQQQLDAYIESKIAPVQQFTQEAALGEAEERAMDILSDLSKSGGEFDIDLARTRADRLLPEMVAKYGNGPKAAEAALEQAASDQRAYEQQMFEKAIAQHTNHLATLAGAAHEPGSTYTVGVQQRVVPDYTQGGSVTSRFFGPKAEQ